MTLDADGEVPHQPPPARGLRGTAVQGFFWSVVETSGGQLFSFVVFLLLARWLAPVDFGLVALALVCLRLLVDPFEQGLADAVVQRHDLRPEHVDSAFWLCLACTVGLALAAVAFAQPVAWLLDEPRLAPIIHALSFTLPLVGLRSVQQALLRRSLQFRRLAVRTLSATVAGGLVGGAMAWSGYGVWSLVGQRITTGLVGVVVLWGVSDWRPGWRLSAGHLADLAGFTLSRMGTRMLQIGSRRTPDLLIGYLLGPVALGYFTVGQRLIHSLLQILTTAISQVALPAFSRLQRDPARMRRAFYLVTRMSSFVGFPSFLGVAILAPRLVPMIFGPQWIPSVPVMQWLAVVGLIQCVGTFNTVVITAMGKPQWLLGLSAINIAVTLLVIPIAAPHGIAAVGLAFVLKSLVLAPLTGRTVRRLIQYDFLTYFGQFVPPLLGAGAAVAAAAGLGGSLEGRMADAPILVLQVAAGALVYVLVLAVAAPTLLGTATRLVGEALPPALRRGLRGQSSNP